MNSFTFKEPYLYRDEDNKKWCVRYAIKYTGDKNFTHLKEYGRLYFGKSLNSIEDLKLREKEFKKLLLLVEMDLKAGKDRKEPDKVKILLQQQIKEASKYTYDECYNLYLNLKGLVKPIPKKTMSAVTIKSFHKRQLKPYLVEKGLDGDINKITKSDMLEFMNRYYLNTDPEIKWSNNTFNNKKGLLSSFFAAMVDEERISDNPVTKIKNKSAETTQRFTTFTKDERDIIFAYLDTEKKPFIGTVSRLIYFAYIRETELARLKVSDFNFETRKIAIHPDNAKGQKDKLHRWVTMTKQLQEALQSYLSKYEHQPDMYIFGKGYKPSYHKVNHWWQYLFRDSLNELKILHPKKFNRPGLSLYSLKHTGVTDFINDNAKNHSTTDLYRYIQAQCRHETFEMTQRYLKKLEINLEMVDNFVFI